MVNNNPTYPNTTTTLHHTAEYFPYGKVLREFVVAQERYISTYHERDRATALDYRNARYSMYDIPRFNQIDPAMDEYPSFSPYSYVAGNPVILVDPDGRNYTDFYDKNGDIIEHVEDGSNAKFKLAGETRSEEYFKFDGYDEKQGGSNVVNINTVIKFAQDYVLTEYTSVKNANGGWTTYCNYGCMNVVRSAESAANANGKTFKHSNQVSGRAKTILMNLKNTVDSKSEEEAIKEAGSGNLVIGGWSSHVITMRADGYINNVGSPRATNSTYLPKTYWPKGAQLYILELVDKGIPSVTPNNRTYGPYTKWRVTVKAKGTPFAGVVPKKAQHVTK